MTIPKLNLSNMVNSDHVNLMEFTVQATIKYPYISEILPEPVAVMKEAYDKENAAYLKGNRSFLTKQVQSANEHRIIRFREVNNILKAGELCTDTAKREACVFLLDIVKDYGGASKIITSRVDSLSGILTNLVEDFQKRFPEKVEAAEATQCVEELRVANETYKNLRSERTAEVSEITKKAMRDARAFSDTAWRGLVDVTNWRYFYKKDAQMLPFMKYTATEVDWYRTSLGQKPGDTNANPDGGSEEDTNPTTPPPTNPDDSGDNDNTGGDSGDNTGSDNNGDQTGGGNNGNYPPGYDPDADDDPGV